VKIHLDFSPKILIGWPSNVVSAHLRDINKHKDLGIFNGTYTSKTLVPHQVEFLVLYPVSS